MQAVHFFETINVFFCFILSLLISPDSSMTTRVARLSKGKHGKWTSADMSCALESLSNGTGLNAAARAFGVPKATLKRHLMEATILTGSPYKIVVEERLKAKQAKQNKRDEKIACDKKKQLHFETAGSRIQLITKTGEASSRKS